MCSRKKTRRGPTLRCGPPMRSRSASPATSTAGTRPPPPVASGPVRHLGGVHPRLGAGRPLQVPHRLQVRRYRVDKADPFAFPCEGPPQTASIVWDLDYAWEDGEWMARRHRANALDGPITIYEVHLGSWRRVPEEGNRFLTYRELAPSAGGLRQAPGLHPRGVPAGHGAPLLRLLGLPDHRLFRAHQPLRHAPGLHVPGGLPAPARHRRHPGLGALPLPHRRARAGLLRRHPSLRARRPPPGVSSRLEELHLQLRPQRGAQLPDEQRPVLAGQIPRRRAAGGRRGLHALPGLLPQGGGVDAQPVRRPGEPGGHRLSAPVQRGGLQELPRRPDHRRGVHRLAHGLPADLRRGAWASA